MMQGTPEVRGVELDAQTRCAHYHKPIDIIAVKMKCCGVYYACKDCHDALARHAIEVWPKGEWNQLAVLCGACRAELTISEYLQCNAQCPACQAEFNPACEHHYDYYFAGDFRSA
jgi:uncharacterized CHY-type Zn-finger protein